MGINTLAYLLHWEGLAEIQHFRKTWKVQAHFLPEMVMYDIPGHISQYFINHHNAFSKWTGIARTQIKQTIWGSITNHDGDFVLCSVGRDFRSRSFGAHLYSRTLSIAIRVDSVRPVTSRRWSKAPSSRRSKNRVGGWKISILNSSCLHMQSNCLKQSRSMAQICKIYMIHSNKPKKRSMTSSMFPRVRERRLVQNCKKETWTRTCHSLFNQMSQDQ